MKVKSLLCFLIISVVVMSVSVSASTTTLPSTTETGQESSYETPFVKTYIVEMVGDQYDITVQPNENMFWEEINLKPGQTKHGKIIIESKSYESFSFYLDEIALPYGNENVMQYLRAIKTTVKLNDEVLYSGPFALIRDKDGLKIDIEAIQAEQKKEIDVTMTCDFNYNKELYKATTPWQFYAAEPIEPFSMSTALKTVIIVGSILFVVMTAIAVYARYIHKKNNQNHEDNE